MMRLLEIGSAVVLLGVAAMVWEREAWSLTLGVAAVVLVLAPWALH